MSCPRCKTELARRSLDGVVTEHCPTCHGTWITRRAFREAAERADDESGWLSFELWRDAEDFRGEPSDLACPACGEPMARLAYGDEDVQVDVCARCQGVWLDPEELERTVAALRTELSRLRASELVELAFDEAAEIAREGGSLAREWRHLARVARLVELRVLTDHPRLRRLLMSVQGGGTFP